MNALARLAEATRGTVWEGDLFLVGGSVRNERLGLPAGDDVDLVTRHDALALARHLAPISEHFPVTYERFGTAMVTIDGTKLEFVTARKESYAVDSRKPNVEPATYEEDAARRDFTCNSLLKGLHDGVVRDPLGTGVSDLEAGVLRTPLDPIATFRDDPLRTMRAVRFRFRLGFRYADGLEEAIRQESGRLAIVSVERWRDELLKILAGPRPGEALGELADLGLLDVHFPEWREMKGVEQGSYHHLDVWDHTRLVVENAAPGSTELMLGALFHDIAKPATRMTDDAGKIRFFGHEALGAEMTLSILRRWRLPNTTVARVARLVKNHMRLGTAPTFTPAAARRLARDLGPDLDALLDLVEADASSLAPGVRKLDLGPVRERLREVAEATPVDSLKSPLSGERIAAVLGLPPGREIGRAKAFLLEKVLEGTLAPDDEAGAEAALKSRFGPAGQ